MVSHGGELPMIPLLAAAQRICALNIPAVVKEVQLLQLGFTHITFPVRGPIRARYLGVEYELE